MTGLGSRILAVAAATVWVSCSDGPASDKPTTTPVAKRPDAMSVKRTGGLVAPKPRVLSGPRSLGSPHAGFIDRVVLSVDGDAAMTRDNQGGVRFWATLDGSSQPLPAPISGAQNFSLARRKSDRWTAAIIDSVGAVHFYRVGVDGSWTELSATKPSRKVAQIELLPGGDFAVALRDDRVLELIDVDTAIAKGRAQKRRFRPTQLRIDSKGKSGIAIEVLPSGKTTDMSIYGLSIDSGAGTIAIGKKLYGADEPVAITQSHASLSADAKTFAYLMFVAKLNKWTVKIVNLSGGKAREVDLPLLNHMNPTLGFIDDHRLIVNTQPNGQTWEIDTADSDAVKPRAAPATHLSGLPAHAFGSKHHLVGLGTWLYVRDLDTKQSRYLGFEPFDPSWAAVSGKGGYVAWATNRGMVYIESLASRNNAVRIESDQMAPIWRLAFAGNRLVTADSVGGIRLVDLDSAKIVDEVDAGGPILQLEVSPKTDLLRVTRQSGQTWLFDLTRDHLTGPYVIDDGSNRAGFLSQSGSDVLWTLDPANTYRTYSAKELRAGLSRKQMIARGTKIKTRVPLAVGLDGLFYVLTPKGTRSELTVHELSKSDKPKLTIEIPSGTVFMVAPSPNGKQIAVLRDNGVLAMFDAKTGKQQWSFSFLQNTSILSWAPDSSAIASASFSGAAVLSAKTGESMRTTCAPWFSIRETAPPNAFSSQNAQLCAR